MLAKINAIIFYSSFCFKHKFVGEGAGGGKGEIMLSIVRNKSATIIFLKFSANWSN